MKYQPSMFGKRFKVIRKCCVNLSQKEVCDKLGVSQSTLSKYESGKLEPSLDVLIRMKDLYNISIDALLGISDKKDIYKRFKKSIGSGIKVKIFDMIEKPSFSYDTVKELLSQYSKAVNKRKR